MKIEFKFNKDLERWEKYIDGTMISILTTNEILALMLRSMVGDEYET